MHRRELRMAYYRELFGALALYIVAIVLANYLIVHGMPGATATPFGTYTLPTAFGLICPDTVTLTLPDAPTMTVLDGSPRS